MGDGIKVVGDGGKEGKESGGVTASEAAGCGDGEETEGRREGETDDGG